MLQCLIAIDAVRSVALEARAASRAFPGHEQIEDAMERISLGHGSQSTSIPEDQT
jgi:hypothetical protein